MRLMYAPPSPFARKVRVAIIEKGLEARVELVLVNPMADDPKLLSANPLSKIPALELDDRTHLIDSTLICMYLDTLSDKNRLIPAGAARFPLLQEAYLANGVLEAAVVTRLELLRPEAMRWPVWPDRQRRAIDRGLAAMEQSVTRFGTEIDLAQINFGVLLDYLDFRLPDIDWRAQCPRLNAWQASFAERPSMVVTRPAENPLAS